MNGLFGLWCKICELANITGRICTKIDTIVMNNTVLCEKIDMLVGDPDAECPECPEDLGERAEQNIAAAEASTATAVATTAQIRETALAIKSKLGKAEQRKEAAAADKTAEAAPATAREAATGRASL